MPSVSLSDAAARQMMSLEFEFCHNENLLNPKQRSERTLARVFLEVRSCLSASASTEWLPRHTKSKTRFQWPENILWLELETLGRGLKSLVHFLVGKKFSFIY